MVKCAMAVSCNDGVALFSFPPLSAFIYYYFERLPLIVREDGKTYHVVRHQISLRTTDIKDKAISLAMWKSYTNIR